MRQFIKTTFFIIAMGSLVVFSKPIQDTIVNQYNYCVKQLASRSATSSHIIGF